MVLEKDYLEEAKGVDRTTNNVAPEDEPGACIAYGIWTYAVIALVDRVDQIAPILQDISKRGERI